MEKQQSARETHGAGIQEAAAPSLWFLEALARSGWHLFAGGGLKFRLRGAVTAVLEGMMALQALWDRSVGSRLGSWQEELRDGAGGPLLARQAENCL